jgi:hypothetical protein
MDDAASGKWFENKLFSGFLLAFSISLRRHRPVYLLAAVSLLAGTVVGRQTGNRPDFDVLFSFGTYLLIAFWAAGCLFAVWRLFRLAAVERHPSPGRAFISSFGTVLLDRERLANTMHGLGAFIVFSSGFAVLKGAIAVLNPFAWDLALARLDRALHFGRAPHEWLWWLIERPDAVFFLNFVYNLWFFILLAVVIVVSAAGRDTALRHRFLASFMITWLAGGFLIATGFSSAGPCYFDRIGLGDDYQGLMEALAAADRSLPIWALATQDRLWDGFSGRLAGSAGISAFPSMHVASAVIFALYASARSAFAGAAMWTFAALIMLGSVVLGWHYAVDGYAGGLIALAAWRIADLLSPAEPKLTLPA